MLFILRKTGLCSEILSVLVLLTNTRVGLPLWSQASWDTLCITKTVKAKFR